MIYIKHTEQTGSRPGQAVDESEDMGNTMKKYKIGKEKK